MSPRRTPDSLRKNLNRTSAQLNAKLGPLGRTRAGLTAVVAVAAVAAAGAGTTGALAAASSPAPHRAPAAGQVTALAPAREHSGTVRLVADRRATVTRHAAVPRHPAAHQHGDAGHHEHTPAHVMPGHLSEHSPCRSSALHQWICSAESIMVQHGTPRSAIDTGAAYIVVLHESGGNPHAANNWDSNAAAGTPSEGIAQTIAPTFSTYALPGHHDIWNPVDNMIAAFRYAISRYGSMKSIPGVVAVRQGGSYVGY